VPDIWLRTLALFLIFPIALAATALWDVARAPAKGTEVPNHVPFWKRSPRVWATAVVFVAIALAVRFSLDSITRTVLETDYYSEHEQWTEVLKSASRMPREVYNVRWHRNTMLALYHTGKLGDQMFRYPQTPGAGLFRTPEEHRDIGTFYQDSRLFLELGYVNDAERCAYESLAVSGDQPAVLQQLAVINIVKGRPETARIFLHGLARHPFHRRAAGDMLRRLEADDTLESDLRVSRLRGNMVEKDNVAILKNVEEFFSVLLEKNPHNKLAFELLMAHYLVSGRPDGVAANLPRLREFSYSRVPRHYQEAWLIYTGSTDAPLPVPGFALDPEVVKCARDFQRIAATAGNPQEGMRAAQEAGLGDTYFLYFAAGSSGS